MLFSREKKKKNYQKSEIERQIESPERISIIGRGGYWNRSFRNFAPLPDNLQNSFVCSLMVIERNAKRESSHEDPVANAFP